MAGIAIFVSFDEMNTARNSFQSAASEVRNNTNNMLQTVNNMQCSWRGAAGEAYMRKFQQLQQDMNEMFRIIKEYCDDLKAIMDNYQWAEQDIQGRVQPLDTDVIQF